VSDWVLCGATYCEKCNKCIQRARKRKHWIPDWYTLCEECQEDVLTVDFCPREESLKTHFKVKFEDVPALVDFLCNGFNKRTRLNPQDVRLTNDP